MAGWAVLAGVDSTTGVAAGAGGEIVSGFGSASISNGVFHWHGTISPETGEIGTQRGAGHAIRHPHGIPRRTDGAGKPFAGPALVACCLFDISHEGAKPRLGLVGHKGLECLAGGVPALGGNGGAGKGVSAFK